MRKKVIFHSPGTFFTENTIKIIEGKNEKELIKNAIKESKNIKERFGAIPFCFWLNKKQYYLPHCKVIFLEDIPKTKENRILISNCESNNWKAICEPTKGYKFRQPFEKNSLLLNRLGNIKIDGKTLYQE